MVAWLSWDSVFKWVGFFASLAAIFGVPVLFYQIRLARTAFKADQEDKKKQLERHQNEQLNALLRHKAEESTREKRHRTTILSAFQTEVEIIHRGAEQDLEDFELHSRNTPRTQAASNESEVGFKRSFVWTPLPMSTIEQAIHEAYLLDLTKEQLESLQDLRLRLLRINSHVDAKIAVMSVLVDTTVDQMQIMYSHRWAGVRADNLNEILRTELRQMESVRGKIIEWLSKDEG